MTIPLSRCHRHANDVFDGREVAKRVRGESNGRIRIGRTGIRPGLALDLVETGAGFLIGLRSCIPDGNLARHVPDADADPEGKRSMPSPSGPKKKSFEGTNMFANESRSPGSAEKLKV